MTWLSERVSRAFAAGNRLGFRSRVVLQTIAITLVLVLIVLVYRGGPAVFLIDAKTGSLSFSVARPDTASFSVYEALVPKRFHSDCPELISSSGHLTALVSPALGATVTYRTYDGGLDVAIRGPSGGENTQASLGTARISDTRSCVLGGRIVLRIRGAGADGAPLETYPIAGPAVLGRPLAGGTPPAGRRSPVSPHLIGGTISIFGRTAFPFISDSLYPATNAVFQIPAGSRVATPNDGLGAAGYGGLNSWYGVVTPDRNVLSVSATTDTKELRFYRPGARENFEVIEGSLFSRLFSDPSFAIVSFVIIAFSAVLQIVLAWQGACRERETEKGNADDA